jgi:hypothetical protein
MTPAEPLRIGGRLITLAAVLDLCTRSFGTEFFSRLLDHLHLDSTTTTVAVGYEHLDAKPHYVR